MSRSNYDKPFYVDVGTSIVAVRCASNHEAVYEYDFTQCPQIIKLTEDTCDRMNKEVEIYNSDNYAKLREALIKVKEWMEHRIATNGFEASATIPTVLEDVVLPALSAPYRNCDRLSADQCKQMFKSEMEVYLPQEITDNYREVARLTAYGVIDALFAPYTEEQKGDNDGSK